MNYTVLVAAFCLVFVLEGLFLAVAPHIWKRMATFGLTSTDRALRITGGVMVVAGLVALQLMRAT